VELRRGATTINVSWPVAASAECVSGQSTASLARRIVGW
jgi:hypothetical protein